MTALTSPFFRAAAGPLKRRRCFRQHTTGLQREPDTPESLAGPFSLWEAATLAALPHTGYDHAP